MKSLLLLLALCGRVYAEPPMEAGSGDPRPPSAPSPPRRPFVGARVGARRLQRAFAESKAACAEKNLLVEEKMSEEDAALVASINEMIQDKIHMADAMNKPYVDAAKEFRDTEHKGRLKGLKFKVKNRLTGAIKKVEWPHVVTLLDGLIDEMHSLMPTHHKQ